MEQLQPAVARMCDEIQNFGGTVLRTLGDGVMALFGVPRALEDHAMLACQAAMSMQLAFRRHDEGLAIRVGLHSGLVASDPASHDAMRGGGAHGLVIHVASRVVALAEPGGICLTEQCVALLRGAGRVRKIGPRLLKGLHDPVEILVLEALDPPQPASGSHPNSLSPFCGRVDEMRVLQEALERTLGGDAQVVAVHGAPGSGKSRLCHEFADTCRARMIPVYQVRAQPYGHATPLQPILEILRAFLFKIPSHTEPAAARDMTVARLAELGLRDPAELALLHEFLGLADTAAPPGTPVLDVQARRARLLALLAGLIHETASAPAVLVLEDLHWLDEASEDFVLTLVHALQGTHALLLLNHRPRGAAAWEAVANFRSIELRELSAEETEELVRALISERSEFSNVCHLVARRSAGNPFFAEELVRSIVQGSEFAGAGAANGPRFEFVDEALPETVQAVIAARIDRLKDEQKKLLQICAIIGKEVPLPVLERVARAELLDVGDSLATLARLEFLQLPAAAQEQFSFGHPLIQEVAYATQLKATRSAIHALVGEAMEAHYASRLDEFSALIGHHYEAAGQPLPAARHIARAARWLSSSDSATATRQWQRVRALLQNLPRDETADRLRLMASSQIAMMGWREGRTLAEVQPYIEEAKSLAAEVDDRLTQLLLIVEGRMLQASGASADEYVARAREALRLVAPGDFGRRAMINATLCQAYGRAGLLREALAANEAASRHMSRIDAFDHEFVGFGVAQWIVAMRGRSLARAGRFDEACAAWQELLGSEPPVDPTVEAIAHLGHVEFAWCEADAGLARAHTERMTEVASKRQVPYLRVLAQMCAGVTATIAGEMQVALPALTTALSLVRANRVAGEFEPEIVAALAECELRSGDVDAARSHAVEAIRLSRARGARIAECRALIIQGLAFGVDGSELHQDSFERAEQLIEETGAIAYRAPLQRARREFCDRRKRLRAGQ